jgi:chromosome segregation ATPase
MCEDVMPGSAAESRDSAQECLPHIETMEQLCDQLLSSLELLHFGAATNSGSAALSGAERACGGIESSLLRLQVPIGELKSRLHEARKKAEDKDDLVKKLQEKLVAYHRKTVNMSEEIRNLENVRQAAETERRRVALKVQVQAKPDSDEEDHKVLEELDQVNRSMEVALNMSTEEIARLNALLQERDAEVIDLQGQLLAQDTEREVEAQLKIAQLEEEELRASRENAIREQFLELSLSRSMQDAHVVQGLQVCRGSGSVPLFPYL